MNFKKAIKLISSSIDHSTVILIIYMTLYFYLPYKILGYPISASTFFMVLTAPFVLFKMDVGLLKAIPKKEFFTVSVFLLFFLISNIFIHSATTQIKDLISYFISFLTFCYVFILATRLNSKNLFNFFYIYVLVTSLVVFLESVCGPMFYISNYLDFSSKKIISRFASGFSNSSLHAGGLITVSYAFAVFYVLVLTENYFYKAKNYFFLALGVGAIFYTMSRAAWVSFVSAAFFLFLVFVFKRANRLAKSIIYILILFSIVLTGLSFVPKKTYYYPVLISNRIANNFEVPFAKHRNLNKDFEPDVVYNDVFGYDASGNFSDYESRSDLSGNTRILSLMLSFKLLLKETFLYGIGLNTFTERFNLEYRELITNNLDIYDRLFYANTHNTFLTYMVEMGAMVGLPLAVFVFIILFKLIRLSLDNKHYIPYLALFLTINCWCQFIEVSRDRIFYIIIAICWGMIYNKKFKQTYPSIVPT